MSSTRPILVFTATAGLVLIAPLLWMRPSWFAVWAIVLLAPHLLIAVRVTRDALNPAGPALAVGVCSVMVIFGISLIALQLRRAESLPHLYALALVATYAAMFKSVLKLYKSSTRTKQHWRLLGRGLVDAFVYYAIVFFIAAGARMHFD